MYKNTMKWHRLAHHKINDLSSCPAPVFGTLPDGTTTVAMPNDAAGHAQTRKRDEWMYKLGLAVMVICFLQFSISQTALSATAQLLMVEETNCPYCARFNAEIAPAYPNTTEGKAAPLRRVNIDLGWPDDLSHIKSESLTPTFILIQNNQELGRLHGYQGDEFFWFLLGELMDKLEPEKTSAEQ